jgi:hypothetical protein
MAEQLAKRMNSFTHFGKAATEVFLRQSQNEWR